MIYLPFQFEQTLPTFFGERKLFQRLFTGFAIAYLESLIQCPIERLKVYLMTHISNDKKPIAGIIRGFRQDGVSRELFRGFYPLMLRQSVAWISFLEADLLMKVWIRSFY